MALLQYTVTLGAGATQAVTDHLSINQLIIENTAGNALVKYGTSALTTALYAGSVIAQSATVDSSKTIGPFPQGCMDLKDFYFLGTEAQVIHLTVITP